jgi:methylase of polypeptide subunit release factors
MQTEQDRLDMTHHLHTLALDGKLHTAPIDKPDKSVQRILDVGTGTGIWAVEMAQLYPSAVVTGTDISPIQPRW